VPDELDAIVMKALAREPDERYATAREFAEALTAWVRASGAALGLRELAAWMDALFPGGRKRAADALERVQKREREEPEESRVRPARRRPEYPTMRVKRGSSPMVSTEAGATRIVRVSREAIGARVRGWRKVHPRTLLTAAAVVLALCAGTLLDEIGFGSGAATRADAVGEMQLATQTAHEMPASELDVRATEGDPHATTERAPEPEIAKSAPTDEPERADPAPALRHGRVNVLTPGGWANVALGDRTLGPTPGQFTLPAGRHRLRLIPGDGGEERIVWVTVRPGRVARVVQTL
jgi:serine/threonine-protein kinase